jgi:hypothetical protein
LRKLFLEKYRILLLNIFEEQVFEDTSYTVCSFQFELKNNLENNLENNMLNIVIYPKNKKIIYELNDANNYIIGGDIYNLPLKNEYKIARLTKKNYEKSVENNSITNIFVKCIDDNDDNKIGLSFVSNKNIYIDDTSNQTARTYASLIIEPSISIDKQKELILKFNKYLEEYRDNYNSLFLTNYRESKNIARKRISFDLVYSLSEYILEKL